LALAGTILFVAPLGKKWVASSQSDRPKPATAAEPARASPPADTSLLRSQALELFNKGDFTGSAALWQELTAAVPDDFEAINNLGVVLKKLNRPDEALSAYEGAIAANPQYPFAYNNLGVLLMEQGKLKKAQGHLERAIELDRAYADPHLHLAILFEKQEKKGDATTHYRAFLSLSPLLSPELKEKVASRLARLNGDS
jgi:Flp pilus assembly protein TadD